MTYQNDPNINRPRTPIREERSYTGWIVAAVAALAVVLGIYAMSSRTNTSNMATTTTPPATTGSAIETPPTTTVPKSDPAPATTPAPAR